MANRIKSSPTPGERSSKANRRMGGPRTMLCVQQSHYHLSLPDSAPRRCLLNARRQFPSITATIPYYSDFPKCAAPEATFKAPDPTRSAEFGDMAKMKLYSPIDFLPDSRLVVTDTSMQWSGNQYIVLKYPTGAVGSPLTRIKYTMTIIWSHLIRLGCTTEMFRFRTTNSMREASQHSYINHLGCWKRSRYT